MSGCRRPVTCGTPSRSSLEAVSPALGFLERRGKTTRLALYAFSRVTFSCAPRQRSVVFKRLCAPGGLKHAPGLTARPGQLAELSQRAAQATRRAAHLKALQRAVAPPVVDCNADSRRRLPGNARLLCSSSKSLLLLHA